MVLGFAVKACGVRVECNWLQMISAGNPVVNWWFSLYESMMIWSLHHLDTKFTNKRANSLPLITPSSLCCSFHHFGSKLGIFLSHHTWSISFYRGWPCAASCPSDAVGEECRTSKLTTGRDNGCQCSRRYENMWSHKTAHKLISAFVKLGYRGWSGGGKICLTCPQLALWEPGEEEAGIHVM